MPIAVVRRHLAVLVAALAATLLLAGCGSTSSPAAPAASGTGLSITNGTTGLLPLDAVPDRATTGLATIEVAQLPQEAFDTLRLIAAGGPFPYTQDGVTFQNRERILPSQKSGFYQEYTVRTPGSSDRGARRIITGDNGSRFYTADHYASFREVVSGAGS